MFSFFKDKIIFISDYENVIGNTSEKLFYAIHKAKRENKQIIFIRKKLLFRFLFKRVDFKQLTGIYNLESKYIYKNKLLDILIGSYYGFIFSFNVLLSAVLFVLKVKKEFTYKLLGKNTENIHNVGGLPTFKKESVDYIDWGLVHNDKLGFNFSLQDENRLKQNLINLGINDNDWFVCLHIRTAFFHNDAKSSSNRNSTPGNYKKAIEFIYQKGGKVVRLGDSVDMSINSICIDYPNSIYKSELMDLYLIKNCRFYIGTNSGIWDTALLLGTQVLGVNYSDFLLRPYKSTDKVLYKKIIRKKDNKKLSLKEVFREPLYVNSALGGENRKEFQKRYILQENTAEEIYIATEEMYNSIECHTVNNQQNSEYGFMIKDGVNRWIMNSNNCSMDVENQYRFYIKTFCNGQCFDFQLDE